jgi:hypothetical protein
MLMNRIMGAFTFRSDVYKEVEDDASFTSTAWVLIAVVAFLNQLGTVHATGLFRIIIAALIGTVFAVIGFALGAYIIALVGREVFKAEVTFDELVRTLGLAYVWQAVAVLGIFAAFSPALNCITAPVRIVAALLSLAAWLIAAKEALDLEWVQTLVTVVIGFIVYVILSLIATAVIGLFGFGVRTATEILR